MTVSPFPVGSPTGPAHVVRDHRHTAAKSDGTENFETLLTANEKPGATGDGFSSDAVDSAAEGVLADDPQNSLSGLPEEAGHQDSAFPMSIFPCPVTDCVSSSILAGAWGLPSGEIEGPGVVANSKLPAADEARSDLALATLGMGAKAAGVVPDALRSIEAASTADDLKVMTVASRAFHLPDEIIVRGQPVRESVPASDPARRDLLDVQMQTRAAITGFPTSADAGQSSLHDQESGMDHDRQHQRNAIKTRAVSEAVSQLQPSAIDVLTPATATVRDVGIAQQITSAVHTVLGESLGGGGTPSAMHADTTSFYQPALRVLDLILQPEELGRVSIKMRLSADGLSVTLEAEKNSTVRLLQQEANGLTDRLIADGYDLEALSVQLFSLGSIGAKEASGSASLNSQHRFDSSGNPDSGKGGPGGQGDQHFRNRGSGREDSGGAEPDAADVAPDVRKHVYV